MNRHKMKLLVAFSLIFIVFVIIKYFRFSDYLKLHYVHEHLHDLQSVIAQYYLFSITFFIISFAGATALSIPGSSVFTTVAGLLFGWPGLMYAVFAATIGATLLFLACRYFIGSWVQYRYAQQLSGFNQEISLHGHHYLLVVRLIAVLPFCLVNMISGLTLISIKNFILATFLGLFPVSVVYIFAGKQLSNLATPDDFFSPPVMFAFTIFVMFKVVLVPVVFKIAKRLLNLLSKKSDYHYVSFLAKVKMRFKQGDFLNWYS